MITKGHQNQPFSTERGFIETNKTLPGCEMGTAMKICLENKNLGNGDYLTIRPVARKGYGTIAIDPWPLRAKGLP